MTSTDVKWSKPETFDGETEWFLDVGGEYIGTMSRERPCRWHGNGVSGLVRDREAPWTWTGEINGTFVTIPDGSNVREAKRLMVAAL